MNHANTYMAMEIEQDVVIVGAGVAGLATAVGLMRVGVRCLVLEKSNVLRTTGAAFTLTPNAWRALDALGVSHKLDTMYTPLLKTTVTTVSNGNVQELPIGKPGNGPRTVHRSVLQDVLAGELPMDIIRFSSKLKSIKIVQHEGSTLAVLSLEDGMIIKAKVVIGCDGVHSVVAQWLGLNPPVDSGRSAVRGLSVFPQGHELKHEVAQFVDGVTRAGYVPLNDKELYWFAITNINSKDVDMKSKEPESIQKMILDNMAHFPTKFIDVVHHSKLSSLSWAPFMLRLPWELLLKDVYKHNITVAGDAMHPMTPDLAQGAGFALEDAVVLCRHIGSSLVQNGKIDSRALKGYVKERRWRAAMLISGSYLSGWIQQPGPGISGWLKAFFTKRIFYKYFPLVTANVVSYDCGKLPTVLVEENTRSKSD